jgi:putative endonuclease
MSSDRPPVEPARTTTSPTTELGRRAEALALAHLQDAGLQLLVRNYRCRGGEIDIVMLDAEPSVLVLVEVRSRSRADYGGAASTIGYAKQRRLELAARHLLLTRRELRRLRARFDVVAIDAPSTPGGPPRVAWIRGAFTPGR